MRQARRRRRDGRRGGAASRVRARQPEGRAAREEAAQVVLEVGVGEGRGRGSVVVLLGAHAQVDGARGPGELPRVRRAVARARGEVLGAEARHVRCVGRRVARRAVRGGEGAAAGRGRRPRRGVPVATASYGQDGDVHAVRDPPDRQVPRDVQPLQLVLGHGHDGVLPGRARDHHRPCHIQVGRGLPGVQHRLQERGGHNAQPRAEEEVPDLHGAQRGRHAQRRVRLLRRADRRRPLLGLRGGDIEDAHGEARGDSGERPAVALQVHDAQGVDRHALDHGGPHRVQARDAQGGRGVLKCALRGHQRARAVG